MTSHPDLLARHPIEVAPLLLGARLTVRGVTVRLTEVEAYGGAGEDPGSHAFRGPGRRNATMFGPPGRLYVYFTYGMHWCANVVCGLEGSAGAVLLRAGEIVDGIERARERRPNARTDAELARGPARLTVALGLTGADDGADLLDPAAPLHLTTSSGGAGAGSGGPEAVMAATSGTGSAVAWSAGPRTGVSGPGGDAAAFPWRFWLPGEPSVSPYRPHVPKRRAPRIDAP
ncbi:MAG: DNA-3-methyladenine glycosylase [Microbacteriaceae bacterium]|nr:DNA-3-methyladenine glycosylase [Microbacteriaceae bacterium]